MREHRPNKLSALQVKEIRDLFVAGEPVKQIAEQFGVTREAIYYQTKGLAPKPRSIKRVRKWNKVDPDQALLLFALGKSQSQIAREMGVTPSSINHALKRMEWKAAA